MRLGWGGMNEDGSVPNSTADTSGAPDPESGAESAASPASADGARAGSESGLGAGFRDAGRTVWSSLRHHWQVPALGAAMLALGLSVTQAFKTAEQPDFSPVLDAAEARIAAAEYESGIELLNQRVYPFVGKPVLPVGDLARFHTLMGRALHGGQRELEFPQPENDQNAVAQFLEAERLEASLSPDDIRRFAVSLLAIGQPDDAQRRAESLPEGEQATRDALRRAIVDHYLDERPPSLDDALGVLTDMLADTGMSGQDRVWALGEQARVRGHLGFHDEALAHLLRVMPTLVGRKNLDLTPLRLALGRAYLATGSLAAAEEALALVDDDAAVAAGTETRAEAILLRGRAGARAATDDLALETALEHFQRVVDLYSGTSAYAPALLGLAELEAALDQPKASAEAYAELVGLLQASPPPREPTREVVSASMIQQYEGEAQRGRWTDALAFADLAGSLWSFAETPPPVLLAQAESHEAIARGILSDDAMSAARSDDADGGVLDRVTSDDLDPASQRQVKRHLIQSASLYNAHAERFIINDFPTYISSLWRAARIFDQAGDKSEAVRAYGEFAEIGGDDPRRAESAYRLGLAHSARGNYDAAAEAFRGLIDERRQDGPSRVGIWADSSLVPLAQALLADLREENDAEAEELLLTAIDGSTGGPNRPEYLEALETLGRLYYQRGSFNVALERMLEAKERREIIDDLSVPPGLRFRIADARRRLADQIEQRLREEMPAGERRVLSDERREHLRDASELFQEVRDELGMKEQRRRTTLENTYLRNASFYLGDCAMDLGEPRDAIAHYLAARNRYPEDPSSLVAFIQIVDAYIELGELRSAQTANERARSFFESFPPETWDDPMLPMQRADWESWLNSNTELYKRLASEG
ncbi:MAG: tetratricopeptide repeat protein [Planctomycetota bacterium]